MDATLSRHPLNEAPALASPAFPAPRLPLAGGAMGRFATRVRAVIRAVQYSRMLQAMSGLSDDQLTAIGLTRADIPAHARACVYGPAA